MSEQEDILAPTEAEFREVQPESIDVSPVAEEELPAQDFSGLKEGEEVVFHNGKRITEVLENEVGAEVEVKFDDGTTGFVPKELVK